MIFEIVTRLLCVCVWIDSVVGVFQGLIQTDMVIIYVWMYTTDKFQNSLGAGGCVRLWRWCESTCTERAGVGWWGFADFEVYEVCGTVHRDTTPVLTLCTPKSHPRHLTQTCLKTPCWNFLLLLTYLESESMFDLWFLSLCLLYASKQSRHLYGLVESPSKISKTPQNTSRPKIAPKYLQSPKRNLVDTFLNFTRLMARFSKTSFRYRLLSEVERRRMYYPYS